MRRRGAAPPERLRVSGATDLERRLLEAVAEEQPSSELRERMAQAIGVSSAALGATSGRTESGAGAATANAAASSLVPWITVGIVSVAVAGAGALVATRAHDKSPAPARSPSSAVTASAPLPSTPTTATEATPATSVETLPSVALPVPPQHGRAAKAATSPIASYPTASDMQDQIALVDAARAALSAGAFDRALEGLHHYQDKYPAGSFRPETTALRIEALAKAGRNTEARAMAERFVAEYGAGPLADRVAHVAGIAGP